MRRIPMRRIVIVGATAGAVLLTGGVAFAFWSSTGTSVGAAEVAAEATDLTVDPDRHADRAVPRRSAAWTSWPRSTTRAAPPSS